MTTTTEKIIIEDPMVIWQPTSFFSQWASSDEYNSSSTSYNSTMKLVRRVAQRRSSWPIINRLVVRVHPRRPNKEEV